MKTVIAPVDFSAVTNRVADAAVKLARVLKARVVLLHVVSPPVVIRDILPAVETVELRKISTGREADDKLAALKRSLRRKYKEIEVLRMLGAPVASILEQAREMRAEYIVIGSHGRSAVYDTLMGSVASGIVKKASCPVLIIPPMAAEAEPPARKVREMAMD